MNGKNKNNSIIFLTTLSVYLGLVLVGAPAVLAQAALTRNFDVQSEIEVKDDLDKKPDDCEELKKLADQLGNQSISDYAEIVRHLIEASGQANTNGFSFSTEMQPASSGGLRVKNVSFTKLADSESEPRQVFRKINGELDKLFEIFPVQKDFVESNVFVKFQLNEKGFSIESKFPQSDTADAQKLFSAYNANLECLGRETVGKLQNSIIKNTQALVENKQFIVITRLPRGSLDEAVKQDAKAKSE